MRYIVDIPPETVDAINDLIKKGEYRTVQDFISTAIQNQIYVVEKPDTMNNMDGVLQVPEGKKGSDPKKDYRQFLVMNQNPVKTVPLPSKEQTYDTLSGLWNKFLPVKITARVLTNMLRDGADTVPLDQLQDNASIIARELGLALIRSERSMGRKRGEKLSTALPTKRSEFKSRMRFKTHFVGSLSRNKIDGMPATLGLINIFKDKDGQILVGITEPGLHFATIENPVIDKSELNTSLSIDERKFILNVIENQMPNEFKDVKFILKLISSGIVNPRELGKAISKNKPGITKNKLASFQSGMFGRLMDLNLVKRTSHGLATKYEILNDANMTILNGDSE